MKRSVQLLLLASCLTAIAYSASPEKNEALEGQIKKAIISYRADTAEMGIVVFVDSIVILDIDSLTKKEFVLKASERFKRHAQNFSRLTRSTQKGIEIDSSLIAYELLKKDTSFYRETSARLLEKRKELDTLNGVLQYALRSLDSCDQLLREGDTNSFGGYIVTAYTKLRSVSDFFTGEEQYLISRDIKAAVHRDWDARRYLDTDTQE